LLDIVLPELLSSRPHSNDEITRNEIRYRIWQARMVVY
jgi:hypothetical protein